MHALYLPIRAAAWLRTVYQGNSGGVLLELWRTKHGIWFLLLLWSHLSIRVCQCVTICTRAWDSACVRFKSDENNCMYGYVYECVFVFATTDKCCCCCYCCCLFFFSFFLFRFIIVWWNLLRYIIISITVKSVYHLYGKTLNKEEEEHLNICLRCSRTAVVD